MEQKIDSAAMQAAAVAATFSPAAAGAIAAGVQVEPMIHALIAMFASLFAHHAKAAVAAPTPAQ